MTNPENLEIHSKCLLNKLQQPKYPNMLSGEKSFDQDQKIPIGIHTMFKVSDGFSGYEQQRQFNSVPLFLTGPWINVTTYIKVLDTVIKSRIERWP